MDYIALITNQDQLTIIEHFIADLESVLGTKQRKMSLASLWETSVPSEAKGQSLGVYEGGEYELYFRFYYNLTWPKVCRDSFFYDDYHNFDEFRKDYQDKSSKTPYVSPSVQWQWCGNLFLVNVASPSLTLVLRQLSATITRSMRNTAVEKLEVYPKWFSDRVLQSGKQNSIIILPIENMSPIYRDEAT